MWRRAMGAAAQWAGLDDVELPANVWDKTAVMELVARMGFEPDEVQAELLCWLDRDVVLNCTRQWGKSTVGAIVALVRAWMEPRITVLVLGPTEGQSGELVQKAREFAERLTGGVKLPRDRARRFSLVLPNGSRIMGLPSKPSSIRCYTASLLLVDEAAFVKDDEAYEAARPALAVKGGQTWLLSTSGPRHGFFYKTWSMGGDDWTRRQVTAAECPRLNAAFLEKEKRQKAPQKYAREYECVFGADEEAIFETELIDKVVAKDAEYWAF